MNKQEMPIWLSVSGLALIVSGFIVKYRLATPSPDWGMPIMRERNPLPFDPLGLSNKWFFLGALAVIGGVVLFRLWRTSLPQIAEHSAATIKNAALIAGFWLALACAVELSATQWTYISRGDRSSDNIAVMKRDPHVLMYPNKTFGGYTVYQIISKQRSNLGLSMIAQNTTPEVAGDLYNDLRKNQGKAQQRRLFSGLSWLAAIGFAVLFYRSQKQATSARVNAADPRE